MLAVYHPALTLCFITNKLIDSNRRTAPGADDDYYKNDNEK